MNIYEDEAVERRLEELSDQVGDPGARPPGAEPEEGDKRARNL